MASAKRTASCVNTEPWARATGGTSCGAGIDYLSTSGTLTFAAGTTSQTITVQVCGDSVYEPNETFFVNLSSATNATLADSQGVGTITNDDAASLTVTSPKEGETWKINSNKTITWTSSGVNGNVNIYLSRDNGASYPLIIGSTLNDGTQSWKVTAPATNTARIRVCSVTVPSVCGTSNTFTIK